MLRIQCSERGWESRRHFHGVEGGNPSSWQTQSTAGYTVWWPAPTFLLSRAPPGEHNLASAGALARQWNLNSTTSFSPEERRTSIKRPKRKRTLGLLTFPIFIFSWIHASRKIPSFLLQVPKCLLSTNGWDTVVCTQCSYLRIRSTPFLSLYPGSLISPVPISPLLPCSLDINKEEDGGEFAAFALMDYPSTNISWGGRRG